MWKIEYTETAQKGLCSIDRQMAIRIKKYFDEPLQILDKFGYNGNTRAEEISVKDFKNICNCAFEKSV